MNSVNLRRLVALTFVLFFSGVWCVFAQSFQSLGDLPGGWFESHVSDISSDGLVVVGWSASALGVEAFQWTKSGGLVPLGDLPTGNFSSSAFGLSGNGAVVVGRGATIVGYSPFRWRQGSGLIDMGTLSGGTSDGSAYGASFDGSVIVGSTSSSYSGAQNQEAFRWTAGSGMVGLKSTYGSGTYSTAQAVSADGSVVVGWSGNAINTELEAFRWTQGTGIVGLGDLNGGKFESMAYDVSSDGKVIVGGGYSVMGGEAVKWENNQLVGLGDLPGGDYYSVAFGVSRDGSVIVGTSTSTNGGEAFIWDQTNGMRNLYQLLMEHYGIDLTGWTLMSADAVSDDGLTIIGEGTNPSGSPEGWIVTLPAPQPENLTLLSPNGGEIWQAGTQHEIKWTSANFNAPVKLWISYEGYNPQFWVAVDLMQNTPNDGSYMWTVPNNPSTNCVIKVADAADGNPWDISDALFTITAPAQSLTVTAPNGGEKWQVGSQHNITWTSQNLSNPVKIAYSTDGGSNYTTIISSTSNDGSYNWTIPNQPSVNCLVRIADATGGNPSDVSDAVFTISSSGNTPTGKNVNVGLGNNISLTFDNVTGPGNTTLNVTPTGSPPPNGFVIFPSGAPKYYNITSTATFTGNIKICIKYDDSSLTPIEESKLRRYVYETPPGKWKNTTTSLDVANNVICGTVSHLSEFAMMLGPVHFTYTSNTGESYSVVIDNATLDGNQLTNGDEIGVFTPAGLCVGAAVWDGTTPLALTAWADDSQTNDVDGYKNGEKMLFKIWDGSTGTQDDYPATPTYSAGNGNFGDGAFARISLLAAVTSVTQALSFSQGWSWISINVAPADLTLDKVMAGVSNLVIVVNGAGQFYIPNVINNIGQMNVLEGYKIYVNAPDQISVTGKPVTATTPISLQAGWNFVSYLPSAAQAAETALASIAADLAIAKNDEGKFFIPNVINSLGNMTPGEGYKLYLNADATLTYPQGSSLAKAHSNTLAKQSANATHFAFAQRTGDSFSIIVKSNGQRFKPGDEIGVFTTAGLCVGAGVWDGSGILGISAWADDDRSDIIDGFREGQKMHFKLWDANKNREVTLEAIFTSGSDRFDDAPFSVVELESPALPKTFSLGQNYPNPFNAGTVISYRLPESGKVTLTVYNLLGEQGRVLLNEEQEAGAYSIHWDGKDQAGRFVPSGVYLYRIQVGRYTAVRKAVFLK
ncbi:MAG: T9SS type A sorting domain-containing protein [bacterium]